MIKQVIIVNGKPRSGKDTFSMYLMELATLGGHPTIIWSTIYKEKEILEMALGRKYKPDGEQSNTDRKVLSELKRLFNENYDLTFNEFKKNLNRNEEIMIVHTREPKEINQFRDECEKLHISFLTVYIEGKDRRELSNSSDIECPFYHYDYTITNTGTLKEFYRKIEDFCNGLF